VAALAIFMACQASQEKRALKDILKVASVAEGKIAKIFKVMGARASELFQD
jgi:transcription initiation factor TFIIIB Brf1 subunit/transcription initiation factor TFIIB